MPYHTIRTGVFTQARESQLWWNRPPKLFDFGQGDKFIFLQPLSLTITSLPSMSDKESTSKYKLKEKIKDVWNRASQKYHSGAKSYSTSICSSNKLSFLVSATENNSLGSPSWVIFFRACYTLSFITSRTLRLVQNINKSRENHPESCFWRFPGHWGVICYCRWPLMSRVFLLKYT